MEQKNNSTQISIAEKHTRYLRIMAFKKKTSVEQVVSDLLENEISKDQGLQEFLKTERPF